MLIIAETVAMIIVLVFKENSFLFLIKSTGEYFAKPLNELIELSNIAVGNDHKTRCLHTYFVTGCEMLCCLFNDESLMWEQYFSIHEFSINTNAFAQAALLAKALQ